MSNDLLRQLLRLFLKQQELLIKLQADVHVLQLSIARLEGTDPLTALQDFREAGKRVMENPLTAPDTQQLRALIEAFETGKDLNEIDS